MRRLGSGVLLLALLAAGAALRATPARAQAYPGYTLYCANNSTRTYLINLSNSVVHSWTHTIAGGYSCYLLEDGNLLRSAISSGSTLNGGGATGLVQKVGPTGTVVWQYQYSTNSYRSHHDIAALPNGNVLLIAWEVKTAAQAVQAGLNHSGGLWPDHIVEVQPVGTNGGTIVWAWHAWDHLIQDYNPARSNYGVVAQHPELLDINLGSAGGGLGGGDWMHVNALSYNPQLDQIAFTSHNLDEIYVIDHSTTTAEAAGHTGGRSGRGGDFLYRWGCPSNYDAPGAQYFDVVHCAFWIPSTYPGGGHLMAFNNRETQATSIAVELTTPVDADGHYTWTPGTAYGPAAPTWTYTAAGFFSNHLGGCQRLPNGNTLLAESTSGNLFEVNAAGATVWSYTPGGEIVRALRYSVSYPGLAALGLASGVEETATGAASPLGLTQNYPNPCAGQATIGFTLPAAGPATLRLFDARGRQVATLLDAARPAGPGSVLFDPAGLANGIYFYRLSAGSLTETRKLILQR